MQVYVHELNKLFMQLQQQVPEWENVVLYPTKRTGKQLIIVVGSQKGLCGNFNSNLFKMLDYELEKRNIRSFSTIAIGKQAVDYVKQHNVGHVVKAFPQFSTSLLDEVTKEVMQEVIGEGHQYDTVAVFANESKSFFAQKPTVYQLIPFTPFQDTTKEADFSADAYEWEQDQYALLDHIARQAVDAFVRHLLLQSLLAEQSARFISMDSSTRNARTLLDETTLQYNKMRQAKITKELTELSESFS
jgi:F-type H+-transporting ATPase subunit gamma